MTDGRQAERDLAELYQQAGFEVYHPPRAKYREQDVFGVFDLLAFGHGRLEGVQVKAGRDAAGVIDWFDDVELYAAGVQGLTVAFAHRKEGCWRLARPSPAGYRWVYDGRESTDTHDDGILDVLRA